MMMLMLIRFPAHDELGTCSSAVLLMICEFDEGLLNLPLVCKHVQAIHRYQKLTELLQGEQPRQLLPPTPRGYILARVRALAEGPCMTAFTWNGGSSWNNKSWTNELPTDSTLVFFLFAAFLEVSQPSDRPAVEGSS